MVLLSRGQEEADADMMDSLNVRQAVLLEVQMGDELHSNDDGR